MIESIVNDANVGIAYLYYKQSSGEGPSCYNSKQHTGSGNAFNVETNNGFPQAMNARAIENI